MSIQDLSLSVLAQNQAHHANDNYDNQLPSEWDVLIRARLLLLMGYATCIVEIETGLSQKRVRKIRRDLQAEGGSCASPVSIKRSSSRTLISSRTQQQRASILMALYTSLHERHAEETDPIALGTAYGLFLGAMQRMGITQAAGDNGEKGDQINGSSLININGAWALAAELRSREGCMIDCTQCGTAFYEAVHQPYQGDHPCPWCG